MGIGGDFFASLLPREFFMPRVVGRGGGFDVFLSGPRTCRMLCLVGCYLVEQTSLVSGTSLLLLC